MTKAARVSYLTARQLREEIRDAVRAHGAMRCDECRRALVTHVCWGGFTPWRLCAACAAEHTRLGHPTRPA